MYEYMTVKEAASYIGISGITVRKYIRLGVFNIREEPYKGRHKKRYLLKSNEVEDFFEIYRLVREHVKFPGRRPSYQRG